MTVINPSPTATSLHDLSESLNAPFSVVTVEQCTQAATAVARKLGTDADVLAMLGVDAAGIAEGVARGYWTQVKIAGPNR